MFAFRILERHLAILRLMIISLFGPDGVGKTTLATQLEAALRSRGLGVIAFSSTNVQKWPEQEWHQHFVHNGIDEGTIEEPAHFLEKIVRCHGMAVRLQADADVVLIDSDPLHKTLLHAYANAARREEGSGSTELVAAFERLHALLQSHGLQLPAGSLYFTLDAPTDQHGALLAERLRGRGALRHFDPKTPRAAAEISLAAQHLYDALRQKGHPVRRIATDRSVDVHLIAEWISALQN